jgi:RimJ/RimL family protein N-acetyltransferase
VTTFELQPRLAGELLELRPLRPEDWDGLFLAASDPLIWEQHPASDRYKEDVFRQYFQGALDCGGALIAIDRATGSVIGSSRYYGHDAEKREIEIGWTFLVRSHWGGRYNAEMKRLMVDHALRFVDRVLFSVGATNMRSRRAMEKIGGVLAGRRDSPMGEHVIYEIRKKTP